MKIIRTPDITKALYDEIRLRQEGNTPENEIHLGRDILYCNYKSFFRRQGKVPAKSDNSILLFALGYALQFFLFPKNKEEVYCIDGIHLRPDIDNQYIAGIHIPLAEVKSTRVSTKRFNIKEYPQYIEQCLGYCKAKQVTSAYLFVFFVCGSYQPPFPTVDTWRLDFEKKEVDNKWQEFLERKAVLEEALKTGEYPKKHYMAFEKECVYCEIKKICPIQNKEK